MPLHFHARPNGPRLYLSFSISHGAAQCNHILRDLQVGCHTPLCPAMAAQMTDSMLYTLYWNPRTLYWNPRTKRLEQCSPQRLTLHDWIPADFHHDRRCWICLKRIKNFDKFDKCRGTRASGWVVPGQKAWPIQCGFWQCKDTNLCFLRNPRAERAMWQLEGLRCQGCDRTIHMC